jgi:DNA gyrase subunit A
VTEDNLNPPPVGPEIASLPIEEEMRRSYLDYAMSVIVARALPDVRDGLKPVHRRILYAMHENGYGSDKAYKKSARIVGDVMGKYHPHGDQAIYDAMVRMAQPFAMRLPLVDGQGNFGSMDGDPPAAMRYTEVRMARSAEALLTDIDKDTVDFQNNYDDSDQEPMVLPAAFPNLLVNGAGGIAVGMATNVPPHNLGEMIDACCAYLEDPSITVEALMRHVQGPDFPTGALILGQAGIRSAFHTGRGSVVMRGRAHVETVRKDREAIVITEIPYQVNKAGMIEKMAEAVRSKRIEGISDLRDESDRDGVRVVIELRRDAMAEVVLNQLYRFTPLQTSFGVNMLALNGGRPELLNLQQMIAAFVAFREEVVTRRTKHLLTKARERAHVLAGLAIAVANIDEVIAIVRRSPDPASARQALLERDWPAADVEAMIMLIDDPSHRVVDGRYRLSEMQARAILDLRLQRLTALGRDEIGDELKGLGDKIEDYLDILRSYERLKAIVRAELMEVREAFADARRTEIVSDEFESDDEDLIQREEMVVTVTHNGYIKRVPLSTYRPQRRGGKGRAGMATRDEDFVAKVFVASTHAPVLFFSSTGLVYRLKVYRLPIGTPQARGKAMVNLLPLAEGEVIHSVLSLPEDESEWESLYLMFATASGGVRRNGMGDFVNVPSNGKIAMKLSEGDRIVNVELCTERDDVLLAAAGGKCIRFPVIDVRVFKGRDSVGVRGIKLTRGEEVVSMAILRHHEIDTGARDAYLRWASARRRAEGEEAGPGELPAPPAQAEDLAAEEQFVLTITENGYGKRTSAYEYRITGRGGSGIINIETSARNGHVVASFPVEANDQIMLVTEGGQMIRCPVGDIRIGGRNMQGVTLFDTGEDDRVVSIARLVEPTGDENGGDHDGDDAALEQNSD